MNTFVPRGADYLAGARDLDDKRLGKQLVECQQIYTALTAGLPVRILHHPATQMWEYRLPGLLEYSEACYTAYKTRFLGRVHRSGELLMEQLAQVRKITYSERIWVKPDWLEGLALCHMHSLQEKDPSHYRYYSCELNPYVPTYPVTYNGVTVGWIRRHSNRWHVIDSDTSPAFSTAWAAIQHLRALSAGDAK